MTEICYIKGCVFPPPFYAFQFSLALFCSLNLSYISHAVGYVRRNLNKYRIVNQMSLEALSSWRPQRLANGENDDNSDNSEITNLLLSHGSNLLFFNSMLWLNTGNTVTHFAQIGAHHEQNAIALAESIAWRSYSSSDFCVCCFKFPAQTLFRVLYNQPAQTVFRVLYNT